MIQCYFIIINIQMVIFIMNPYFKIIKKNIIILNLILYVYIKNTRKKYQLLP